MLRSILIAALVIASVALRAQAPEIIPGDIIVQLAPGADASTIATDCAKLDGQPTGLRVVRELSKPMRAWLLHHDATNIDHEAVVRLVRSHPGITIAQSNHVVEMRSTPNDPLFGSVWHHDNIDSEAAWDITTGGVTATGDTIVVSISLPTGTTGAVNYRVLSLLGQAVITRTVAATSGPSSITLDLASLAPGTYLLEIETGGERIVRKVVRE